MEEKRYQISQEYLTRDEVIARLGSLAMAGLKDKDGRVTPEKKAALEEELAWLERCEDGFLQRFLILWDALDYARCTDNPTGPGMGTLPGSVLAYGLGLTGPDPLRAGLRSPFLERPPQLTLELGPVMMGEVPEYLQDIYGPLANSVELVCCHHLDRFRQVLTGDSPADKVWTLPASETEGARHFLENIPLDDPAVFDFLARERDICLFERPEAWTLLRDLRPRCMEELTDAVAFCSIKGGGAGDPRYMLCRQALQEGRKEGPYGWLLYREQVEDLLLDSRGEDKEALSRLEPDLAEVLRGWAIPHAWGENIVRLSLPLLLLSRSVSKSHAAARALLTYQDTYLRVHYPRDYERAKYWYLNFPEDESED